MLHQSYTDGQTGAGKTHTLSDVTPKNLGMMPRAAADIFRKIRADKLHDHVVTMSYIQIYMELIQVWVDVCLGCGLVCAGHQLFLLLCQF